MRSGAYTTSYSRALFKYSRNEFLARPLSLDDREFIQRVCDTGRLDCGSLSQMIRSWGSYYGDGHHRAPEEEQSYWEHHWQEEPKVERRLAPEPTPAELARREVRAELQRIGRISAAEERAEMQRIHDEEERRILAERRQRIALNKIADAEWELAAGLKKARRAASVARKLAKEPPPEPEKPKHEYRKPNGTKQPVVVVDDHNHYVPEWEWGAQDHAKLRKMEQEEERKRVAHQEAEEKRLAALREAEEEAAVREAKRVIDWRADKLREGWEEQQQKARDIIKKRLLHAIRGSGHHFTIDDLTIAVGCQDRNFVARCANELVQDGMIGMKR